MELGRSAQRDFRPCVAVSLTVAISTDVESQPATASSPRELLLEVSIVFGALWLPFAYSGIADFVEQHVSPGTMRGEGFAVMHAFFISALPIVLFMRLREPITKLGIKRFQVVDFFEGLALWGALVILSYSLAPLEHALRGLPYAHISRRISHLLPLWIEPAIVIIMVCAEEIVQRAYLCSRLHDVGLNRLTIVLVSAILFTIPHLYYGWGALFQIFFFGVILATYFTYAKKLWPMVMAHAGFNFLFIVLGRIH